MASISKYVKPEELHVYVIARRIWPKNWKSSATPTIEFKYQFIEVETSKQNAQLTLKCCRQMNPHYDFVLFEMNAGKIIDGIQNITVTELKQAENNANAREKMMNEGTK